MISRVVWSIVCVLLAQLGAGLARAQTTPSDVLRHVDAMAQQVALFRFADGLQSELNQVPVDGPRMPRHVLQQARIVHQRIEMLRWLNGLDTEALVPVPPQEIRPADVLAVVEHAREALTELAPIYGVPTVVELPERRTQVEPEDVMAALQSLSEGLGDLGLPDIVPNDVFRIARAMRLHADGLAQARGVEIPTVPVSVGDRQPADVFEAGMLLLDELQQFDDVTGNRLPGGVAAVTRPPGRVDPLDVIRLLELILADLYSVSVALGDQRQLGYPAPQVGRTPADVFEEVSRTRAIVAALTVDARGSP